MHEFSICQSLVSTMLEAAGRAEPPAQRILKTRVVIGALRQVIPESLMTAYDVLTKETLAEGSLLEIVSVPIKGRCRTCGWDGELSKSLLRCSSCGSSDMELEGGKELFLESVEIEHDD